MGGESLERWVDGKKVAGLYDRFRGREGCRISRAAGMGLLIRAYDRAESRAQEMSSSSA